MATTKKTTKKKKNNGPRSRKYGCVTYNSEPQDNPDCHKGRCSPPARMISQDGTTKVTQIRYRRRNLDVVSKNCACSLKPASKTKKSAGSKTKKATPKKTVAKAPAKVKAPAKPKAPAKVKAPTKAKVKAKAPSIAPVMPKLSKKDVELLTKTIEEKGKKAVKEFGERLDKAKAKAPAKAPVVAPVPVKAEKKAPQKKAPQTKPAIVGTRFDQVNLRNSLAFLKKLNGRQGYIPVPIFRHSMTYIDPGHICMVKITSRVPDKSIMGLPLSRTNQDAWVPQENLYDRLNKDITGVRYSDGRMYFDWDMPGGGSLSTSTIVSFDYGDVNNLVKLPPMFTRREDGDHVFRTTQARFAADVKKVATYSKIPRPNKYDHDGSVQLCPMGKVSKPEEGAPTPKGCATYSEAYLHAIAEFIAKAKNGSCVVIHRDKYPLKVICDCGQYVAEILLAPQWRPEDSE